MIELVRASWGRCLLVQVAATATAGLLLAALVPAATASATGFEAVLVRACTTALLGCTAWAWVLTTVVVHEALAGRAPGRARRGVPQGLRRLVLRACGLALVGATAAGVTPAAATPDHLQQGIVLGDPLVGLPLPERAVGSLQPHARVLVEPGDTLWDLAAERLARDGRRATDAAVASYWPRVHRANRDVVGADPDLLRPGLALRLPPTRDLTQT